METRTCGVGAMSLGSSAGRILTTSVQKFRSLAKRNCPWAWKWQIGQSSPASEGGPG
jgi:hypothetical protein